MLLAIACVVLPRSLNETNPFQRKVWRQAFIGGELVYKKVLLAYDGTREGRAALREGAVLARTFGAEVFLLAIVPAIVHTDAAGLSTAPPDTSNELFEDGLARAKELGLSVSGALVSGDPVIEIKTWAKKLSIDLVVVGHRRKTLLERWWSGPSHAFLSDHLDCSLLISSGSIGDDALPGATPRT